MALDRPPEALEDKLKALKESFPASDETDGGGAGAASLCATCDVAALDCGGSISGELSNADCLLSDDSFLDLYRFELDQADSVNVSLTTQSFDAFLFLTDRNCLVLENNDNCTDGDTSGSCLTLDLPPGEYFVAVNSLAAQVTGSYELTLACSGAVPPILNCPMDFTVQCEHPDGMAVDFEATASAADPGDPLPVITYDRPPGSIFALGTHTVNVTARDAAGNTARCSFTLTVEDTVSPSLTCPETVTLECTAPEGATLNLPFHPEDSCDRAPAVLVNGLPIGTFFALGCQSVQIQSTDASGNTSSCDTEVCVVDTTAPSIVEPEDRTVDCVAGEAVSVDYTASVTDLCDVAPTVTFEPPSGTAFGPGTSIVTLTARDASGNAAQTTFNVTVRAPDLLLSIPDNTQSETPVDIEVVDADADSGYSWEITAGNCRVEDNGGSAARVVPNVPGECSLRVSVETESCGSAEASTRILFTSAPCNVAQACTSCQVSLLKGSVKEKPGKPGKLIAKGNFDIGLDTYEGDGTDIQVEVEGRDYLTSGVKFKVSKKRNKFSLKAGKDKLVVNLKKKNFVLALKNVPEGSLELANGVDLRITIGETTLALSSEATPKGKKFILSPGTGAVTIDECKAASEASVSG